MATQLYVGNVSYQMTEESLKKMFSEFGEVTSAKVVVDRETGRSKGFGFVEMADAQA
ncbi:MAG TPA: RNA-binding protein, partial [bacterium]|nr:RNA-binding protein [bacterium]